MRNLQPPPEVGSVTIPPSSIYSDGQRAQGPGITLWLCAGRAREHDTPHYRSNSIEYNCSPSEYLVLVLTEGSGAVL